MTRDGRPGCASMHLLGQYPVVTIPTRDAFERWRREAKLLRHRGHAISYRCEGTGPDLVAIHGFPSASWDWHPMWPGLTARFRVIAADMIGYGWSAKPRDHEYSIFDQATLHENLLRELAVDRVHVLAHDYGDTVAQELLARHEDRRGEGLAIESVCFLNGGLFPECHRARRVQTLLASRIGPLVARLTTKRTFARSMHAIFGPRTPPSAELVDELWTLLRHDDGHLVVPRLIGYMAERRRHRERWVGVLQRTRVPIAFVDGSADPVSGAHMLARWRELLPTTTAVDLAGIGHYPQIEDPAGTLRAFTAFHDR
jgi:pimeloyl-ACP methyl ester carboxylesterase